MLFIYLYHDVLYADLWKSDPYVDPPYEGNYFPKRAIKLFNSLFHSG